MYAALSCSIGHHDSLCVLHSSLKTQEDISVFVVMVDKYITEAYSSNTTRFMSSTESTEQHLAQNTKEQHRASNQRRSTAKTPTQ